MSLLLLDSTSLQFSSKKYYSSIHFFSPWKHSLTTPKALGIILHQYRSRCFHSRQHGLRHFCSRHASGNTVFTVFVLSTLMATPSLLLSFSPRSRILGLKMSNNEYDKPNQGCVHLLVHFDGEVIIPILNVDPDRYSYFDLVDDINGLATDVGYKDAGLSMALSFFHPCSESGNSIKTDSDVLDMFKLNNMCSCIHVYAKLLNHEETKAPRQVVDTIISESDVECVGDEIEQKESEETDSSSSDINEEWKNEINIDEA